MFFLSLILLISICHISHCAIVSLTFSDGLDAHMGAAKLLRDRGFNGTFYLNSENVAFKKGFMNVFDIDKLVEWEFEIGSHSVSNPHFDLSTQDSPTVLEQICRDRARLTANRWVVQSFHYPFGKFNELTTKVVKECGFNSALIAPISSQNTTSITYTQHVQDALKLPIYAVEPTTSFQELIALVEQSVGWTILNFHNGSNVSLHADGPFMQFLNWLNAERNNNNIVIKSIDQVINGPYLPIPEQYTNTLPTETPDPNAFIKLMIGSCCIGLLAMLVLYVAITTQIKKRKNWKNGKKIKFVC